MQRADAPGADDLRRPAFDVLQKQQALGGASGADVLLQQALLASALATLPPLQKQLAPQRDLIRALTGSSRATRSREPSI